VHTSDMSQTGQQQAATQEGWWLEGHGSGGDRTAYSAIQPPGEGAAWLDIPYTGGSADVC
jgi:hypothetical protein